MMEPILLYAEDNLDDRVLFTHACTEAKVCFRLFTADDGQATINFLSGVDRYANRQEFPIPDGVLLDVKMPVLDGFSVLRWIREQDRYEKLPVFIYTSSYQHADIKRAYQERATAFLSKPSSFKALVRVVSLLYDCFSPDGIKVEPLSTLPQYKRP
jgi:CheY-like chemotaxis protein